MNDVIMCGLITMFIAQFLKIPFYYLKNNKIHFKIFFSTGSMPSSHTATMVAATTAVGVIEGFGSAVYGLSFVMTAIIMHDAVKVRGESGKHAQALNIIIEDVNNLQKSIGSQDRSAIDKQFKEMLGHTYSEVLGGLIVGLIVPLFYF